MGPHRQNSRKSRNGHELIQLGTLSDQQFHDRYVLIEHEGDDQIHEKEVWILTNSLSSIAKRFPLVICKAPPETSHEIANYLAKLQAGNLPERPDLRAQTVWE
jgi:hypothetical protein